MPFSRSAIGRGRGHRADADLRPASTATAPTPAVLAISAMLSAWLTISKPRHQPHLRGARCCMNSSHRRAREAGLALRVRRTA
jgi:hypothetical protein